MKIVVIMILLNLLILSCGNEKKDSKMVDISIINEDGTLNTRKLFKKEIEKDERRKKKTKDQFE